MRFIKIFFILAFTPILTPAQHTEPKQSGSGKPFVLGTIEEIQSAQLKEKRLINIYLPEEYKQNDTSKYAVIYLLDGSANEDFIHITGLVQFNSFPWINRIPKSIVVGIANVDRKRDFTYPTTNKGDKEQSPTSGHSDNFIAFLEKELEPYIQSNYRTNDSKTLIGESLGGLLATEILLKKPFLFNKYIIVSPSLWWDNGSLLNLDSDIYSAGYSRETGIYIGVGKEGLTPGDFPHVMEVDANLLAEKIKKTKSKWINVHFDYLPQEDHATVIHQAVYNALKILYPLPADNN